LVRPFSFDIEGVYINETSTIIKETRTLNISDASRERIHDSQSARVRAFYDELGLKLPNAAGPELSIRCFADPYSHSNDDAKRSASLNIKTGLWKCHGCDASGNPYQAAIAVEWTPAEALALLRKHGLDIQPNGAGNARETAERQFCITETDVSGWQQALLEEPQILARLRQNHGWSEDAIRELRLGFDRDRITFPVRDRDGVLVGLLRYSPRHARGEERKMLAEPGSQRQLFPAPESVEEGDNSLLLVEGEPDAVAAHSLGLPVVAVPGANGWRQEWSDRFIGRKIVVVADADEQGRQAARTIADDLASTAAEVRLLEFEGRERGFDLSDFLNELNAGSGAQWSGETLKRLVADAPVRTVNDPPETWPRLLEDIAAYVRRFIVLSDAQVTAVSLWIAHTHALDAAETTPYLAITSAEKRSGKSLLIEILERLAANALHTVGISEAAIFRSLFDEDLTLLLDETDAIFSKRGEREGLRGLINAGYRRGATVPRCVGDSHKVEKFPVFCAKALAGIGRLPDTIADRSIPIRLKRAAPGEGLERLRWREQEVSAQDLRCRVARLAEVNIAELKEARPDLPQELNDRAADGWEPLLAVADSAGTEWSKRARKAALELSAGLEQEEESVGIRLLADTKTVYDQRGVDRMSSADLAMALSQIEESPWGDWNGRGFDARALARELKRYGIRPKVNRINTQTPGKTSTPRSYTRDQFEDSWKRYLPTLVAPEPPLEPEDATQDDEWLF
jgi:hypothetical protein